MKKGFFTSNKYLNFKDLLLFIGIYFTVSMLVSLSIMKFSESNDIGGFKLLLSYAIIHAVVITIMLTYRKIRTKNESDSLPLEYAIKLNFPSPLKLLWGVILVFAASIVVDPLVNLFPESGDTIYTMIKSTGVYGMISAVIAAPILEEIIFRGIIMTDIRRNYSALTAILISSLTFALVHFNLAQFAAAFLLGTVFGYIFLLTKSLSSVIFLHFFNNSISYMIIKLLPQEMATNSFYELIPSKSIYYVIYTVSVVVILFMIVRMVKLSKRYNNQRKTDLTNKKETCDKENLKENTPVNTKS